MADYLMVPALTHATIEDYVSLFRNSFSGDGKLNAVYLRWQYESNPHGRVIGMDAFMGNKLVAHYAVIPRRYRLGAEIFDAALSVNTATDPQHQGKGLFTRLATATYDLAAQQGIQFIVGAANANSLSGFIRKLGFLNLGNIRLYVSFRGAQLDQNLLNIDSSAEWLHWRLANPSRRYQILQHSDGTATIQTRIKSFTFNIARIKLSSVKLPLLNEKIISTAGWAPGLTPFFGPKNPSMLRLPLILQPSPWHIIWRSLSDDVPDSALSERLQLYGLAMDTF